MTRLTIEIDEEVAKRVDAAAADRGLTPEALAAEALNEKFPPRRRVGFVSLGSSGDHGGDIARRHHEIIHEHFANKTARDV